jgi:hypothetical protein
MDHPYISPFFGVFESPIGDSFWLFVSWFFVGWIPGFYIHMARYMPFVVAGLLIAVGVALWRRLNGRRLKFRALYGAWIGFLVGLTYDSIGMIAYHIMRHMTPDGCVVKPTANEVAYLTPYMNAIYPRWGETCQALVVDTVIYFAIFAVIGIGLGYLIGRTRGTRMWIRFIKGATYGVLTAGPALPFFILFDDKVVRYW